MWLGKAMGPGQRGGACGGDGQQGHCWSLPGWRRWELIVLLVLLSQESIVVGDQPACGEERRKKSPHLAQRRGEVRKEQELVCCFLLHVQPQTPIDGDLLHYR